MQPCTRSMHSVHVACMGRTERAQGSLGQISILYMFLLIKKCLYMLLENLGKWAKLNFYCVDLSPPPPPPPTVLFQFLIYIHLANIKLSSVEELY